MQIKLILIIDTAKSFISSFIEYVLHFYLTHHADIFGDRFKFHDKEVLTASQFCRIISVIYLSGSLPISFS